jgi:hypothetical protein
MNDNFGFVQQIRVRLVQSGEREREKERERNAKE